MCEIIFSNHRVYPFAKHPWAVIAYIPSYITRLRLCKVFCMPSSNPNVYFHTGEYKKDELLEAAR